MDTDFGPEDLAVRDFNGDGKVDIVVAHCCGDTDMTYFQGNGDGTFRRKCISTARHRPSPWWSWTESRWCPDICRWR